MTRRTDFSSQVAAAVMGTAFVFVGAFPALAGDAAQEVSVAAQHAGYAADALIITTAHTHLHHTVNCLVGPDGQGFDAKELNPCQGKGNGALPDTTDTAKKQMLQEALAKAQEGLASDDLATAKLDAAAAQAILKKAM
jgi:hypothetical protein